MEAAVPGIQGLSFVDDISWWADGADSTAVAAKLSAAAAAAIGWAAENGVAFDSGKTEAALFHKKRSAPRATVAVGTNSVPFNKEATRWLGIWLDAQLSLKEHHATRMNEGRQALTRLRRLTVSRTWRDRLLGAGAGAAFTLVILWLVLVSTAAAAVILRA